jgi:hypothetical protein
MADEVLQVSIRLMIDWDHQLHKEQKSDVDCHP